MREGFRTRRRASSIATFAVGLALLGLASASEALAASEGVPADLALLPAPGTEAPRLLRKVAPSYPLDARRDGIAGVVIVWARVGRDGRVRETRIEHSIAALDAQAEVAARRYEFAPARRGEDPVECWVQLPVRFDESLPSGARAGLPVDVTPYGDAERNFESEVAMLQQNDPAVPGEADAAQRERVGQAALALDMIPPPGDEAVRWFQRGDSVATPNGDPTRDRRREAWMHAAHLAPWWVAPYRRLAAVSLVDRRFASAQASTRAWLAARPGDPEAIAMQRRIGQVRQADRRRDVANDDD